MTGATWPTLEVHLRFARVCVMPSIYSRYYRRGSLGRFLSAIVAGTQGWFDDDGARHLPLFRSLLGYGLAWRLVGVVATIVLRRRGPAT